MLSRHWSHDDVEHERKRQAQRHGNRDGGVTAQPLKPGIDTDPAENDDKQRAEQAGDNKRPDHDPGLGQKRAVRQHRIMEWIGQKAWINARPQKVHPAALAVAPKSGSPLAPI